MPELKLAIIVGSNRSGSINRQLAEAIAKLAAASFEVRFVRTDDLPLYNQDLEANFPESAERMKQAIVAADGILVVTPEHNRSIPAALKSAIDWASRPPGKGVWSGKPIAITGTSRGSIGTAVAQQHLRAILGNIGGLVMPGQTFVTFREGLVDENHAITDEKTRAFLQAFITQFASLVAKLTR
jgi:chromate reductase